MDSVDQLSNKFIQEAKKKDLQEFCEKQFIQIQSLCKEVEGLKNENEHLKKLLTSNESFIIDTVKPTPEELICLQQIQMLQQTSEAMALTLEESKKLDTYVKLLRIIRNKEKVDESFLKNTDTKDLLKLVEDVETK
jgi:hypothetical protein